jgi:hypothetical protein
MTPSESDSTPEPRPPLGEWLSRVDRRTWMVAALLLALFVTVAIGLRGCGEVDPVAEAEKRAAREEEEKRKKEEQKRLANFYLGVMRPQPNQSEQVVEGTAPQLRDVKPGHWITTLQDVRANNFDFVGEFETTVVDHRGLPVDLERTAHQLATARPVALPKSQTKYLEATLFIPYRPDLIAQRVHDITNPADRAMIDQRLRSRIGGGDVQRQTAIFNYMPDYQYHFVVLARQPSDWTFLARLTPFKAPQLDESVQLDTMIPVPPYQLVLPQKKLNQRTPIPLSGNPLTWTTVAGLLWDGFDPDELSREQQQALITWLHWGGQLVVSGPDSLDTLRGKFLEPYLAATAGETRKIDQAALEPLNDRAWSDLAARKSKDWIEAIVSTFTSAVSPAKKPPGLSLFVPGEGIELKLHADAKFSDDSGDLLAERRVGRGRVIVSAMKISPPRLRAVPGKTPDESQVALYEGFFARQLMGWASSQLNHAEKNLLNPEAVSAVRLFSRDADRQREQDQETAEETADLSTGTVVVQPGPFFSRPEPRAIRSTLRPGVAAWSDTCAASTAARDVLRKAAGIKVPEREFVLWVLGLYLAALVPANWAIFRAIGRVEWAWIAAPILSIACTIVVVKLAQLDIGFARSRTEIAVVEMQPGFSLAHVTRYTALYASFSTGYEARFADPGGLILPFAKAADFRPETFESRTLVQFRNDGESVALSGFAVTSNSTGMLHSEQMADMQGTIHLAPDSPTSGTLRIINDSPLALGQALIIAKNSGGKLEIGRIGAISARGTANCVLRPQGNSDAAGAVDGPVDSQDLQMKPLIDVATSATDLRPGDIRLVAQTTDAIPGLEITPTPSQDRYATLIVAHLKHGD